MGGCERHDAGVTPVRVKTLANGATVLDRAIWVEDAQGGYFRLESGAAKVDRAEQSLPGPAMAMTSSRITMMTILAPLNGRSMCSRQLAWHFFPEEAQNRIAG